MKVLVDSNIIIADFRLKSPDWKLLLESSKNKKIELIIPQVVLDEVLNKFKERVIQSERIIYKEISKLKKLTETEFSSDINEELVKNNILEYSKFLDYTFKEHKVKIADYPKISHKSLVKKAINKTKPFNENEKGYRDCLIWENVKEYIPYLGTNAGNPEVIFITNNNLDFFDKSDKLHTDLLEELEEDGFDLDSIKVYKELNSFNTEINHLNFIQVVSFKEKLSSNNFEEFELKEAITKFLEEELINNELPLSIDIPYYYQNATGNCIDEVNIIEIDEVVKLNSSEFVVSLFVSIILDFDFYIEHYEHYSNEDFEYSITDSTWNEHVMLANQYSEFKISITIVIDDKLNLVSGQIN